MNRTNAAGPAGHSEPPTPGMPWSTPKPLVESLPRAHQYADRKWLIFNGLRQNFHEECKFCRIFSRFQQILGPENLHEDEKSL